MCGRVLPAPRCHCEVWGRAKGKVEPKQENRSQVFVLSVCIYKVTHNRAIRPVIPVTRSDPPKGACLCETEIEIVCVCVCVCVCVFIKLHITAQSGPPLSS